MTAKLEGLPELTAALEKLGKGITPEIAQTILRNSAGEIVQIMKSKVRRKSGRLANSIKIMPKDSKFPYNIIIGPDFTRDGKGTMTIAALASVQEFGARVRVPKKKKYAKVKIGDKWVTMSKDKPFAVVPAAPFVRPTFDMTNEKVRESIKESLIEEINNQAKKEKLI
ncbi:MAG: HK97 gp10 family phage protein [Acinetobacter sp.]|uniref:HK97 gp10 family phage protein n=1 Tax=Acinetobacter sp. TaxID=472 RepID=UPI000FA9ED21|nr:HK97 gp10 family phage protein [Acinetobacter sp.]RUP37051.1 MAG: HK97 gp10 family phage protein [Acinetobacter sp.]